MTTNQLAAPNLVDMVEQKGIYREGLQHERLVEQTDYLSGVLHADPQLAHSKDPNVALELDRYGYGTPAFWRGFIEGGGGTLSFGVTPILTINASFHMLDKFAGFLTEGENNSYDIRDTRVHLREMCSRGYLRFTGPRAQRVVERLYEGAWISAFSKRLKAEDVMRWRKQ